jgi:AAA domain
MSAFVYKLRPQHQALARIEMYEYMEYESLRESLAIARRQRAADQQQKKLQPVNTPQQPDEAVSQPQPDPAPDPQPQVEESNRIREWMKNPIAVPSLNQSQQENIMTLLAFDEVSCLELRNKVELFLFDDAKYRAIVSKTIAFIDEFGAPPKDHLADLFDEILNGTDRRKAELYNKILSNMKYLSESIHRQYVLERLDNFIKQQRLKQSVLVSAQILQADKPGALEKSREKLLEGIEYTQEKSEELDEMMYTDLESLDDEVYSFLPLLGHNEWFVKYWSHILSAYPKTGKTELFMRVATEWKDETVLYLTEENREMWKARWKVLPAKYKHHPHIKIVFSRDKQPAWILQRIRRSTESVIVVDTVNELLGIEDEADNPEIRRVLRPYINTCTKNKQTFVGMNHDRKSGGQHGKAVSGGAAFVGAVDKIIEINYEGDDSSPQRRLTSVGRIFQTQPLVYELLPNYEAVPLGAPRDVSLKVVKDRVKLFLTDEWKETKPIRDALKEDYKKDGLEPPSDDTIQRALKELVFDKHAERDPPIKDNETLRGVHLKWRLFQIRTSGRRTGQER